MKPTQTVLLLLAVVGLIFGVTFASMYVSEARKKSATGSRKKVKSRSDGLHLTFEQRQVPADFSDPLQRITTEYGKSGQADFWFENPHDDEVRVGLNSKNCTCSEVQLCVAPPAWRATLVTAAVAEWEAARQTPFSALAADIARLQEHARTTLASRAEGLRELTHDSKEEVAVPGRSIGFVRMRWEARRNTMSGVRPENLTADVWMQVPGKGSGVLLQAGAVLVDGLRIDVAELNAGTLESDSTVRRSLRCWSTTRNAFDLEMNSSAPVFIVSGPREPLTAEDVQELTQRGGGRVLSGFRFPVTIRERAEDGSRFDEGAFTHYLRLKPAGKYDLGAPLEVTVRGAVRGDLTLGTETGLTLQPFLVKNGTSDRLTLQTRKTALNLKVDRVPDFMKAKLSEPVLESGMKSWVLTVEIAPNKVSGSFPRGSANDPLRDTAIYLKVDGADRRVRIPVSGKAQQ